MPIIFLLWAMLAFLVALGAHGVQHTALTSVVITGTLLGVLCLVTGTVFLVFKRMQ